VSAAEIIAAAHACILFMFLFFSVFILKISTFIHTPIPFEGFILFIVHLSDGIHKRWMKSVMIGSSEFSPEEQSEHKGYYKEEEHTPQEKERQKVQ
jgi:cytochrome b subunit of formate dehydrogenase